MIVPASTVSPKRPSTASSVTVSPELIVTSLPKISCSAALRSMFPALVTEAFSSVSPVELIVRLSSDTTLPMSLSTVTAPLPLLIANAS